MYLIIGGYEWLLVVAAVIVILIWGPSKLPALARGVGEALREFRKASSGEAEKEEAERKLLETAKSLGISTEGKTKEQLLEEINKKIQELKKG